MAGEETSSDDGNDGNADGERQWCVNEPREVIIERNRHGGRRSVGPPPLTRPTRFSDRRSSS